MCHGCNCLPCVFILETTEQSNLGAGSCCAVDAAAVASPICGRPCPASHRAQAAIKQLQDIVLILLCIEGVLVCLSAAAYVVWLLYRVSVQRAALFTVFLTIPNGFLKTLANKNIKLSAEEGDSDGEQLVAGCPHAAASMQKHGCTKASAAARCILLS
jgi:hypothetical protein